MVIIKWLEIKCKSEKTKTASGATLALVKATISTQ